MDQLYTYEILQELKSFDSTDFFTQIVLPLASTFFGFFGAYYLLNKQFKKQEEIESKIKKDELESVLGVVKIVNQDVIESISSWLPLLDGMQQKSEVGLYHKTIHHAFDTSVGMPISQINFSRIIEIVKVQSESSNNRINSYWKALSSLPRQLDRMILYQFDSNNRYNAKNQVYNENNNKIFQACDTLILEEFPAGVPGQISGNNRAHLAYRIKSVMDRMENRSARGDTSALEVFLIELQQTLNMNGFQNVVQSELKQNVRYSINLLSDKKAILSDNRTTIKNYMTLLSMTRDQVVEFDKLL